MTIQNLGTSSNGNFVVSYDDSNAFAKGMAQAVLNTCEADFTTLIDWFGLSGFGPTDHINVAVQSISAGGANNFGYQSGGNTRININLFPTTSTQARANAFAPVGLVAELAEVFMDKKWGGSIFSRFNSDGEGLSQLCAALLHQAEYNSSYRSFAGDWLTLNPRPDWVTKVEGTDTNAVSFGCSLMFLYYLKDQLGFTPKQIILAGGSSLAVTYRNLTGDPSNPFSFFANLVNSTFPVGSPIPPVTRQAENDPFPLFLFQFGGNKTSFSKSEVANSITTGVAFSDSLRLVLEGCSPFTWNALSRVFPVQPVFAPGQNFPGMHFNVRGQPIIQNAALQRAPQRIEFVYDVSCDASATTAFSTVPQNRELDSSITIAGKPSVSAKIELTFYGAEDPYFITYAPNADNVPWLSYDLRVFSAVGGSQPVHGFANALQNSNTGAYNYIQGLLPYLSANFGDPSGIDPFDPNNNVIPGQSGALTGDSSVIPSTEFLGLGGVPVYNFAVARVRLNGPLGAVTNGPVRVFFRLWESQQPDTTYSDSTTYNSHKDNLNQPDYPLLAPNNITTPYFATDNYVNIRFTDPSNKEYSATGGANSQIITINHFGGQWIYFGCYLNVYDPTNTYNGTPITNGLLPGTHHCLVAQIAYDDAPIQVPPGGTTYPGQTDKLAQRNLSISPGYNPGLWPTNRVPQTFSVPPTNLTIPKLGFPVDELMIDWGQIPIGTIASIYWPGANAAEVIRIADSQYAYHSLKTTDKNTIETPVTSGPTYIPIPVNQDPTNLAGLLTFELPPVRKGNTYTAVIKRVTSKALPRPIDVPHISKVQNHPTPVSATPSPRAPPQSTSTGIISHIDSPDPPPTGPTPPSTLPPQRNPGTSFYRITTGGFQVTIPIQADEEVLPYDEETLSIMKYRVSVMKPTNRWHPVLVRYVDVLSKRIDGHGGNSKEIPPSQTGLKCPPVRPGGGGGGGKGGQGGGYCGHCGRGGRGGRGGHGGHEGHAGKEGGGSEGRDEGGKCGCGHAHGKGKEHGHEHGDGSDHGEDE